MIAVESLTKRFGRHVAVDNVTFGVGRGETLGLLGPNGAGKTTIMRMMTGYTPPSAGRVVIDGIDMYDAPDEAKKKIGYLPEQPPVYMDLTVGEYLAFAARIKGVDSDKVKQSIERAAGFCGITDKLGRLIGNLSKGYRQRVGLAQALVHDPDILILDEPTVGLDPKQIIEIRELIKSLGQSRTVILSSHILQEVTFICKKVAIINRGRMAAFDSIENLSGAAGGHKKLLIKVAHMDKVDLSALKSIPGVADASMSGGHIELKSASHADVRAAAADRIIKMGAGLLELRETGVSLEEAFMRAVAGDDEAEAGGDA